MRTPETVLSEAYALYQRGDFAGAEALGRQLVARGTRSAALDGLIGMAALQAGRAQAAVPHLRAALGKLPNNVQLRSSLAFALVNTGELDEARTTAGVGNSPQLRRIVAFVDQQQGRGESAIAGYRQVLRDFPQDYESWDNLGLLLSATGDIDGAVEAFGRALSLHPDPGFEIHRSQALAKGARHAERQAALRDAARHFPANSPLLVELGLAEGAVGDFAAAETAYRTALEHDPRNSAAYLEYGMLLETLNRLDDMRALIERARAADVGGGQIAFVEAWLLKREGRFTEALERAEASHQGTEPSRRAQLIGDIEDRLGHPERAFAAFSEMNRLSAEGPAAAFARAQDFPGQIVAATERLTPTAVASWSPVERDASATAPIFLLGFPRSGTTLLDTLLMNLPEICLFEEAPMLDQVEAALGDPVHLASIGPANANQLRSVYFNTANAITPVGGRIVLDKFPLHMVRTPLIHRLFPDAPIVMVERHPYDVVLSCFMARFQTNRAMVQFQDLTSAARLYDVAMQAWERAVQLLPLRVHRIRYEKMVGNLAGEMRPLLDFLGLEWRNEVLDNHASATRRTHIATASYAQVNEPIYTRAIYRWERYRKQLEPILPVLAPWAERLGYGTW